MRVKTLSIFRVLKWYFKKGNAFLRCLLNYETTPKFEKRLGKNINAKFDIFMKKICDLIIEADKKLFKNRTQEPSFVLSSLQKFLNSKLDGLSLQQLECEMDCTDYPDNHNFFK